MTNQSPQQLPCIECRGRCCKRGAYDSKHACIVQPHEWRGDDGAPDRAKLVDVAPNGMGFLPFNDAGDCIMLDKRGRCTLYGTSAMPENCRRSHCVQEGQVHQIEGNTPGLIALLTRNGVAVPTPKPRRKPEPDAGRAA